MSDEEENYDEEEDEEIAAEEAAPPEEEEPAEEPEPEEEPEEAEEPEKEPTPPPPPKPKPRPIPAPSMDEGDTETEAEKAMKAAKKKHEEEAAAKLEEFERNREVERQKQEEELEILKEKQRRRQEEREADEAKMAELAASAEETKQHDEEMKRAKMEQEKQKKEAFKKKRQAAAEGKLLAGGAAGTGRNFSVPKKDKDAISAVGEEGGGGGGKREKATLSKEEYEDLKKQYMINAIRPLDLKGRDIHGLRDLIKTMHKRITNLENKKYDMEKRFQTQDYDIRELNERRKQSERQKALAKGLDPEEAVNSPHPPKISVASKFDRQIDRRPYEERKQIFRPKPRMGKKLYHGTARPPPEFGRPASTIEELELLRKNMEPPKYVEEVHMEGAKPPVKPMAPSVPADDEPVPLEPAPAPAAAEAAPAAEE